MNPAWRTGTVVALCRRMLDAREFDALPILADALQDAGCTDPELLTSCQDGTLSRARAERLVNLVYSDKTAAAVRWLEQFVRDIDHCDAEGNPADTYESVVEIGRTGLDQGHITFVSIEGAHFFWQSDNNRRAFFRNWSLVTGVAVPDDQQARITFSCTC
ncbi:hypothetical protein R5W23_005802 [Gemmata sp. JC673]|uniref:Uncharacterized protein n=1 Tax=Gemmata algarum TaxID=2975278 RepID=A0ABU5EU75_9BACT|nr:hypothetical protein [Gemmata algarum]MDY3558661.1 hypothetical protein [Gemmata algarum]